MSLFPWKQLRYHTGIRSIPPNRGEVGWVPVWAPMPVFRPRWWVSVLTPAAGLAPCCFCREGAKSVAAFSLFGAILPQMQHGGQTQPAAGSVRAEAPGETSFPTGTYGPGEEQGAAAMEPGGSSPVGTFLLSQGCPFCLEESPCCGRRVKVRISAFCFLTGILTAQHEGKQNPTSTSFLFFLGFFFWFVFFKRLFG